MNILTATHPGPIICDVDGLTLSPEDKEILNHPLIGGVILFTRNYQTKSQLKELVAEIRTLRPGPFLLTVDQEGGRVQRFKEEFMNLPALGDIGKIFTAGIEKLSQVELHEYIKMAEMGLELAQVCGWLLAYELLELDIDLSFAPVVDLQKHNQSIIGSRAFHQDPNAVIGLANAFISGMNEVGMQATLKHFPGHGSVIADSHLDLPVDERSLSEIENDDLYPFRQLIEIKKTAAVMAAHILFPEVDDKPVCFSSYWLQTLLRKKYHFDGMIFSDDLSMRGADIIGDMPTKAEQALAAGCDMILICNNRQDVIETVKHLKDTRVNMKRFSSMQGHRNKISDQIFQNKHIQFKTLLKKLNIEDSND